ncbi:hypothetical protein [Niallia sp. BSM11]|uniref:hypothetical protein n=1 Tax=Niallia sp. BSM11 TaxID=3391576 RepID=UPI003984B200
MHIVNDIVETYGPTFNDEILQTMEQDLLKKVQQLGGVDTQLYLEEISSEKYEQASFEEQQLIDEISLKFTYVQEAKGLEERYRKIDLNKEKAAFFQLQTMPSWLEQMMLKEFNDWERRFHEIVVTNEYKQWFFLSDYKMHSKLFRTLMKTMAIEGVLLVVLITVLITNYEFEQRTQLVTYATKKGRKLILHKGTASLIASLSVISLIFVGTLATYFSIYDYSAVWQTSISSGLNWESKLPYITWWNLSLWQYTLLAVGILTMVLVVVVMLTFTLGLLVKNSYYTWLICVMLLITMYVVPSFFSNGVIQLLTNFNITLLLLNPHYYFNGGTTFMMMKYHEVWTILLWLFIASISISIAIRYFNRKDVV